MVFIPTANSKGILLSELGHFSHLNNPLPYNRFTYRKEFRLKQIRIKLQKYDYESTEEMSLTKTDLFH